MPPPPPPPVPLPPPIPLTLPTPPALPRGSTILVTGANGLIASHICDFLLAQGHHVRGTVRSLTRSAWLAALLTTRHGGNRFSLIEVPDMSAPGAFDDAWAPKAFTGDPDFKRFPTFYWINIKDMARLHVAALLHPEVKNERIFGFAGTYTMNEFLAFYRKHYPDREFPADIPGVECDLAEIEPAKRAEELLKEMGRPGYETLEDTVLDNVIDIA
ncbi:putative aldehyde reductase [Diplodia seriata]|nr:putative aldehyde reductase [Diplodia seriata]